MMIRKHILFLLLCCCSTSIYGKSYPKVVVIMPDFSEHQKSQITILKPPSPDFSVFTVFGGLSTFSGGFCHTTPNAWLILAGHIPVNHEKIYLYLQFRTSFYMGESTSPMSDIVPIIHMENTKLGFLLGVGGIVKDWRKNDIGWHIRVNGGIVFEGGVANSHINFSSSRIEGVYDRFLNIGLESNAMFYYSFKPHFSVNLGVHFGYQFAPYSGDPFYTGTMMAYTHFDYLTYGVSVGVSF